MRCQWMSHLLFVSLTAGKVVKHFLGMRKGGLVRQCITASQATAEETLSEKRARRAVNEARRKGNREMHALRSDFELKLQVSLGVHTVKCVCVTRARALIRQRV